jgi:hypothetical protein
MSSMLSLRLMWCTEGVWIQDRGRSVGFASKSFASELVWCFLHDVALGGWLLDVGLLCWGLRGLLKALKILDFSFEATTEAVHLLSKLNDQNSVGLSFGGLVHELEQRSEFLRVDFLLELGMEIKILLSVERCQTHGVLHWSVH